MVHSEDLKDDSTFLFRWALRKDEHARLFRNECSMLHWICGVKVEEHFTITELYKHLNICHLDNILRYN